MAKKTTTTKPAKPADDGSFDFPAPPEPEATPARRRAFASQEIKAAPPTECAECGSRFFDGVFYDAKTSRGHRILCSHCFGMNTINLNGSVRYTYDRTKGKWYSEKL